jgi:hypothetical protein
MWTYVHMWFPTLTVALTAAICFSVASFVMVHFLKFDLYRSCRSGVLAAHQTEPAPSPTQPELPIAHYDAQVGQARLAVGEGLGRWPVSEPWRATSHDPHPQALPTNAETASVWAGAGASV